MQCIIRLGGEATITGGTLESSELFAVSNEGALEITGGTITGGKGGLYNEAGGTITLGVNDTTINTTTPSIISKSAYGVQNNGGSLYFYDGVITGTQNPPYYVSNEINKRPETYINTTYDSTTSLYNSVLKVDDDLPTVTLGTNGGTYATNSEYMLISTTLTATDTGESGLKDLKCAWSNSNEKEPTSWTPFTNGGVVSANLSYGTWYLWTYVTDNAGNRATTTMVSEPYTITPLIPEGYYYVGGAADTLLISNNSADENIGLDIAAIGKTYKWISDETSNSSSYANKDIAASVSTYGGYFVDSRYSDSNDRKTSSNTYLDIYEATKYEDVAVCRRTGIWNADDLSYFRDDVNAGDTFEDITVYVMDDIDMSSVCSEQKGSWERIGNYIGQVTPTKIGFSGIFEGNNKTISNIYIKITDTNIYGTGLFSESFGTIRNFTLTGNITGTRYVGGIVGANRGTITNCINKCTINSTGAKDSSGITTSQLRWNSRTKLWSSRKL